MLLDEIEKMKKELAEMENEDHKNEEVAQVEESDEEKPEESIEAQEESKEEEKEKAEEPSKEKEELDDKGYARLRREAAAEKRRAEQLQKELEELRKSKEIESSIEEPQITLPPEFQSVIEDHRTNRAEKEFLILENKAKQQYPDYNAITTEYAAAMYQSIRLQNPRKSDIELNEMTKKAILMKAGELARAGYENPVEEMYHEAKELGFTGKSFQKEEKFQSKEEKIQPDLRRVAGNRKRSSGMAANNGRSEGMMTLGAAADLTAAEWAKLPVAEKRRLMYGQ